MSAKFAGISRLMAVIATVLMIVSGCGRSTPQSAPNWVLSEEILTVDQMISGTAAVVTPKSDVTKATLCGPDGPAYIPSVESEFDPHNVQYEWHDQKIAIGVWDQQSGQYGAWLEAMSGNLGNTFCMEGKDFAGHDSVATVDWRVEPLDFESGVVAFRAVQWSLPQLDESPSQRAERSDNRALSTIRAYGVVKGKMVMVRISHQKSEPPTDEQLRVIWDAQAAKIHYYDAISQARDVQSVQSDPLDRPVSEWATGM